MRTEPPGLFLLTPVVADAEAFRPALETACASGEVAAVLLRLAPADERTLVNRVKALAPAAQGAGAALVVADPGGPIDLATVVTRGGADGAHADDLLRIEELGQRLGDSRDIGAGGLATRHAAMEAGERGVDYVMFGEGGGGAEGLGLDDLVERAAWWAEIFQTPCCVVAPSLADVGELARTGAEFVGLGDPVWTHPEGPGAAVSEAARRLAGAREVA